MANPRVSNSLLVNRRLWQVAGCTAVERRLFVRLRSNELNTKRSATSLEFSCRLVNSGVAAPQSSVLWLIRP